MSTAANRTRISRVLAASPRDATVPDGTHDATTLMQQHKEGNPVTQEDAESRPAADFAPTPLVPEQARLENRHSRQQLVERVDRFLEGSLASRALLREAEQMIWTASREADPEYDSAEESEEVLARGLSSQGGSSDDPLTASTIDVEARRAQRLQQCDTLLSALAPVRYRLDSHGCRISEAAAANEELQKRLDSLLQFSDEDIAAELALQASENGDAGAQPAAPADPGDAHRRDSRLLRTRPGSSPRRSLDNGSRRTS